MTKSDSSALALSRRLLRVLIFLNLLVGFLILVLLVASLVAKSWVMGALRAPPTDSNGPLILGMQLLAKAAGLNIGWKFSPTPWLAVLLLFVLAHVFDHGTRMREELEGTV